MAIFKTKALAWSVLRDLSLKKVGEIMKLSISNIAWASEHDAEMYTYLKGAGFQGLEIAPTRVFPEAPYDKLKEARLWATELKKNYNLSVPSIQSIWYGHTEKIFGSREERQFLIDYTKKAIDFAENIGCQNLVFGNPKNRDTKDIESAMPIAINFFKEIGEYALEHNTVIAIEPNPAIYNTHFINNTEQAVEMAYRVSSEGVKVNVDLSSIIYNEEDINYLKQIPEYIHHVHISEPWLHPIKIRELHKHLFSILHAIKYDRFVSLEMGKECDLTIIKSTIKYLKTLNENDYL